MPISPTFHFMQRIFFPFLSEVGIGARASIKAYGFYPRGGGEIEAHLTPVRSRPLDPVILPEKKTIWAIRGVSAVANLPVTIAERQKKRRFRGFEGVASVHRDRYPFRPLSGHRALFCFSRRRAVSAGRAFLPSASAESGPKRWEKRLRPPFSSITADPDRSILILPTRSFFTSLSRGARHPSRLRR